MLLLGVVVGFGQRLVLLLDVVGQRQPGVVPQAFLTPCQPFQGNVGVLVTSRPPRKGLGAMVRSSIRSV